MTAPDFIDQITEARRQLDDVAPPPPSDSGDYEMFLAKMLSALRVVSGKRLSADERLMVASAKQDVIDQITRRKAG